MSGRDAVATIGVDDSAANSAAFGLRRVLFDNG